MRFLALFLVLVAVPVIAACGGGNASSTGDAASRDGATVAVHLSNWEVKPSKTVVNAGTVTFRAIHEADDHHGAHEAGSIHELAVARKNADGTFEVVGQAKDIAKGQSKDLTLALEPGEYELQCNVVEEIGPDTVAHYVRGMHTTFRVS